jgi:Icc-related predicted phosphoesterase
MMLLVFVDTHGDMRSLKRLKKKAAKADLVLCAGDITVFESHMRLILREINSFNKPVLIIPGNHEGEKKLRLMCKHYKNLVYLHNEVYELENVFFAGWGGGGFSLRDPKFEKFAAKLKKKIPGKKLILMLHGPPYGNKTDLVESEHTGNKSFRDFIKQEKPLLVVCGHLHENAGVKDKIGKTIIINPGPDGKLIEV